MRKIITLILTLFFANQGMAQLENDKVLHFAGGAIFGTAGAGLGRKVTGNKPFSAIAGALIVSSTIGVSKEALDSGRSGGEWDNGDLLATVLGGLVSGTIVEIFAKDPKDIESAWNDRLQSPTPGTTRSALSETGTAGLFRKHQETGISAPVYLDHIPLMGL